MDNSPLTPIDTQRELVDRLAIIELGLERVMKCLLNRLVTIHNDSEKAFTTILDNIFTRIDKIIQVNSESLRIVLQSIQNSIIQRLDYSDAIINTVVNRIDSIKVNAEPLPQETKEKDNAKQEKVQSENGKGLVDNNNGQGKSQQNETIQQVKESDKTTKESKKESITSTVSCPVHLTCNCQCPTSEAIEKLINSTNTTEKLNTITTLINNLTDKESVNRQVIHDNMLTLLPSIFNNVLTNSATFAFGFYGVVNGLINASIENNITPQAIYNQLLLSLKSPQLQDVINDNDEKCITTMKKKEDKQKQPLLTNEQETATIVTSLITLTPFGNPDAVRRLPLE